MILNLFCEIFICMHALLEYWTEMFDYSDRANRKVFYTNDHYKTFKRLKSENHETKSNI